MSNDEFFMPDADQGDDPAYGWTNLFQPFDPIRASVSPAPLGSQGLASPFDQVLVHMVMGGDPNDLPPTYQHIVSHVNMLLAQQPPSGLGVLGDVLGHFAAMSAPAAEQGAALDPSTDDGEDEAQDHESEGDEDQSPDAEDEGPDIPANPANPVGPLDTRAPIAQLKLLPQSPQAMAYQQAEQLLAMPEVQSFLNVMRSREGGGRYDAVVRGLDGSQSRIADFSRHPNLKIVTGYRADGTPIRSSAAGAYQFTKQTWDSNAKALGLTDFTPHSQDLAAVHS